MTVHTYIERDASPQPRELLGISYKGFNIRKKPEHSLYAIIPPEGKRLHSSLDGSFTGIEVCERHIDSFLGGYTPAEAFLDPSPQPRGRGRPRKERLKQETKGRKEIE